MFHHSFPHFRQMDSFDCGATCLQMIAKYYGKNYSQRTLREYSFISREGSSLMGVCDAAEKIGFRTTGVKTSLRYLQERVTLPCMLHWNQNHYVVLYRIRKKRKETIYHVADPASYLVKFSEKEFKSHWLSTKQNDNERGIVLMLQPDTNFYLQEDERDKVRVRGISHFFRYLIPYKWQLGQIVTCMVMYMILGLIFPFLTQSMVDVGIRNSNLNFVILILVSQFILTFTDTGINFLHNWIALHVSTRIDLALMSDFWRKLMNLPIRFFDTRMTGDLMQRLGDHGRIRNFLINDSISILFSSVTFLLYSILLGYYNLTLLFVFLTGHLLYAAWVMSFLRYRRELDYQAFDLHAKNRSCVIQLIQGMQEIKLNNNERQKRWEWEELQARFFHNSMRGLKIDQIKRLGAQMITRSTGLTVSFLVAKQVIEGEMTFGMMMALSYIMGHVSGPISNFIEFIHSLQNAQISLERLNEIHGQEEEENEKSSLRTELPQDKSINITDLSFSYSGSPREYVLKGINLFIPAHKITAIVGVSGSGKTTIMRLLQGFYNPQEGEVKVDETPLRMIKPHLWRSKVGAVMQDGYIFSDTIAKNIAVGEDEIDKERLVKAVRIANIGDFINKLPLGFNTKIGMEGNGVSQGQRQRILIARAVYKNPEYLFFDEATNALDSKNEKTIMKNLMEFYKGKTVVICAHRLSTIRHADQIVVLNDGHVVEMGTHDELMKRRREYFHLVENQLETINE